tara:strand:+ start:244 stop:456 length:213 start_codon:yes stop_codon:yes gene_type:complete
MSKITVHDMKTSPEFQDKYPEYMNQGKYKKPKRGLIYYLDLMAILYFALIGFDYLSNKVTKPTYKIKRHL